MANPEFIGCSTETHTQMHGTQGTAGTGLFSGFFRASLIGVRVLVLVLVPVSVDEGVRVGVRVGGRPGSAG